MQNAQHELESHRHLLTGHCYRMLGSVADAEDAVQETMIRAWRNIERFEGRASVRTWMVRIATNVCLDALKREKRRIRPMETGPAGTVDSELTQRPRTHWLEPIPEACVIASDATPADSLIQRESIRLAFVAALQNLPPKQRAALLLTEVLGFSAAEAADTLETSVPAVNSALQRARATLGDRPDLGAGQELTPAQREMLEQFVAAFEAYDVGTLTSLLRDDVTFSMPPFDLWLQGPDAVRAWLLGHGIGCKGSRVLPTAAAGAPAFAQYRAHPDGVHRPWALIVLELDGDRIAGWNSFLEPEELFIRCGLPLELRD